MIEFLTYATVGICLLLLALLLREKVRTFTQIVSVIWLLVTVLELVITFRLSIGLPSPYFYYKAILPTLHVALLFLYLKSLIQEKMQLQLLWHLAPFGSFLITGFFVDAEVLFIDYSAGMVILLLVSLYLLLSIRLAWVHASGPIRFIRNVLILYAIIWVFLMAANSHWITYRAEFLWVSMLAFVVLVWVFVLNSLRLAILQEIKMKLKYVKSGMDATQAKALKLRLESLIENEKPFLDPNLKVSDLGRRLEVTDNYISQVVNSEFGLSFNDFINQYRVNAFKSTIIEGKKTHLTLFAIAEACGFKSKSTFNAAFKKATGTTPSAFKASLSSDPTRSVA